MCFSSIQELWFKDSISGNIYVSEPYPKGSVSLLPPSNNKPEDYSLRDKVFGRHCLSVSSKLILNFLSPLPISLQRQLGQPRTKVLGSENAFAFPIKEKISLVLVLFSFFLAWSQRKCLDYGSHFVSKKHEAKSQPAKDRGTETCEKSGSLMASSSTWMTGSNRPPMDFLFCEETEPVCFSHY